MGGFGSGRTATQPAVEHGLTLNLGRLLRQGKVRRGAHVSGVQAWSWPRTGESAGEVGYEADLRDPGHAWLRLRYVLTSRDGAKTTLDYRVPLATTAAPFGGARWWFVCPRTGRLATKLYRPPGAERFASRLAFRMAYQSQRHGALFRAQAGEARVVRKLGAVYEYPNTPQPPCPKWMRHKTYERLCAELAWWQGAQDLAFIADTERFMAMAERMDIARKRGT